MKKIISNVSIVFVFILLGYFIIRSFCEMSPYIGWCNDIKADIAFHQKNPELTDAASMAAMRASLNEYSKIILKLSLYAILEFLALGACAFLFVYCNPKLFRRSTWVNLSDEWAKNKEERAAARAAKADADKQKRIEELQAELDALNSDKN